MFLVTVIICSVFVVFFVILICNSNKKSKYFFKTIKLYSDEEFIAECGLIIGTNDAINALKIRNIIARLGKVPPSYISPQFKFSDEMLFFSFWRDFDSVIFARELQQEFNLHDSDIEKIKHPYDLDKTYKVENMIKLLLKLI